MFWFSETHQAGQKWCLVRHQMLWMCSPGQCRTSIDTIGAKIINFALISWSDKGKTKKVAISFLISDYKIKLWPPQFVSRSAFLQIKASDLKGKVSALSDKSRNSLLFSRSDYDPGPDLRSDMRSDQLERLWIHCCLMVTGRVTASQRQLWSYVDRLVVRAWLALLLSPLCNSGFL